MSKEYIEREAAIDTLCGHFIPNRTKYVKEIRAIPAADVVEVRHGRWVCENYDPEYTTADFHCSECGLELEEYYFADGNMPGETNHYYCPNCGAKMDGGANDD